MYYYKMKFNPLVNEYVISHLDIKGVDRTKMHDDVTKWASNIWICKNKKELELFAEREKEKNINRYKELIKNIETRTIKFEQHKRS